MIINGEYDTLYFEHISFFNTKSMNTLCNRNGLILNKIITNPIHGNSYIFEIKLEKDENIYNVDDVLDEENKIGLFSVPIYDKFTVNANRATYVLKNEIEKYKKEYKIISFGAPAKGMTTLFHGNIDLDYIIDENPLKIGLYSPKLNIQIVSLDHFVQDQDQKFLIIILAWNFSKEIIDKINKNKGNKEVIIIEKYFPELKKNLKKFAK